MLSSGITCHKTSGFVKICRLRTVLEHRRKQKNEEIWVWRRFHLNIAYTVLRISILLSTLLKMLWRMQHTKGEPSGIPESPPLG